MGKLSSKFLKCSWNYYSTSLFGGGGVFFFPSPTFYFLVLSIAGQFLSNVVSNPRLHRDWSKMVALLNQSKCKTEAKCVFLTRDFPAPQTVCLQVFVLGPHWLFMTFSILIGC